MDEPAKFVLLDIGTAPAPVAGTVLHAYSGKASTAELEVSRFQKRPFLIADIKSGNPKVGDGVFLVQSERVGPPDGGSDSGAPRSGGPGDRLRDDGENQEPK